MVSIATPLSVGTTPVSQMPTKIPARRPTLVRKRDNDDQLFPTSPGKKARVTFVSEPEIHLVDNLRDTPELVLEEVRQAFESRGWGDNSGYERLKKMYNPKSEAEQVSPDILEQHIAGLLCNISSLNKDSADLVRCVIQSRWLAMHEEYVTLYVRLISNILSSQGVFLGDTLRMLVDNFRPIPPPKRRMPGLPPVTQSVAGSRVHKMLHYMLQLLPPAARVLSSVLVSSFPHQTDTCKAHALYISNLLKVADYAPQLRSHILNLITERLVKIDIQVQVGLEDLTDEAGESLINGIPRLKASLLSDAECSDESESDSEVDEHEDAETQRTKSIIANVEKMDVMLDMMFEHYSHSCSQKTMGGENAVIDTLLSQFATIILPTHRSRHTQFLLFHFLQQSSGYIDTFVGACTQITFDRNQPGLIRQAAAAYLASFVSRGSHVPPHIVRDVFDYIGGELRRLRRQHEPDCRGPDLQRYSTYYSLVQALLYIFCFRWRDLEQTDDEGEEGDKSSLPYQSERHWRSGVKEILSQNLYSKLNPLKICSPAIVTEFARIANHMGVVYVYHILETNKRIRLSHLTRGASASIHYGQPNRESALSTIGDERHLHLEEYFPFDPYHLPTSKRWIEGDYREWAGIPGLNDDQETSSGSELEEDAITLEAEEGTETDGTGNLI